MNKILIIETNAFANAFDMKLCARTKYNEIQTNLFLIIALHNCDL